MEKSVAKIRGFVTDLLKKNKALTEREVKAAIGRAFKLNPKTISAGVIRDVRKKLGIDRPGAIAFAKALLDKNPVLEAKKVIEEVGTRFGVRLGAPDVSRLRPAGARRRRGAGRADRVSMRRGATSGRKAGAISVTYQGSGHPEDLAAFFRSLAGD
ncbi:MAG TPA: hypothetical protein VMV60_16160 [Thermoanaerobaculia bacterium]|nr:hypothetical protein [Thermoanaerobaculia bacterium]